MHFPVTLALFLNIIAIPVMAAPPSALHGRTPLYKGDAPGNLSPCGVSLYIGNKGDGKSQCTIATSTDRSGSGEFVLHEDNACTPNNPMDLITEDTENVSWSMGSVGKFKISQTAGGCDSDGGDCFPVLEVGGISFKMWEDDACSMGNRAHTHGFWWRCQISCYKAPDPLSCKQNSVGDVTPRDGEPQRVTEFINCDNTTSTVCTASVSQANTQANSLTTTHDVTDTTTTGGSITISRGANLLALTADNSLEFHKNFSHAVTEGTGTQFTDSKTFTTQVTRQQPNNTAAYFQWTSRMNCKSISVGCSGGTNPEDVDTEYCEQAFLSDGKTADGKMDFIIDHMLDGSPKPAGA